MPAAHFSKIEYRPATVTVAGWVVLADESVATLGARISGFQPVMKKSPMSVPGYGAAGVAAVDMGNQQWSLAFNVEREHADEGASAEYLADHAAVIGALGNIDLKITLTDGVTYMPDCAITDFTPAPANDKSSMIHYAFVGPSYTTTEP